MENVKFSTPAPGKLVIEIDLNHRGKFTGKTYRVASTEGNVALPGGADPELRIGLNVYTKTAPASK